MSNTQAIFAFYTCTIASVLYTVIGSNRRFSYGVFSLVSAIYLGIIINRIRPHSQDIVGVVIMSTFLIGVYSIVATIFRMGSFVRFLPYEVLSGFRAGLYVLVFSMQLNSILGLDTIVSMDLGEGRDLLWLPNLYSDKLLYTKNDISWYCVVTSVCCMVLFAIFRLTNHYWSFVFGPRMHLVKNVIRIVPIEFLLVMIGFVVANNVENFQDKYKMPLYSNKTYNDSAG